MPVTSRLPALFLVLLCACAPRGAVDFKPDAAEVGVVEEILVATNRVPVRSPDFLSASRSASLRFFDFAVSVPPDRKPGTVSFPGNAQPDASRHFVTVSAGELGEQGFRRELDAQLRQRPTADREVTVFVHGYNTNFAEGLYRQAQMSHDFGSEAVSVNFAWPSAGSVMQYAADRETALFARDSLERVLHEISRSPAERIVLLAHSMGAHIAMETLRQMHIRGDNRFYGKLASVALLAPDIDLDVFLKQAGAMKERDVPIFIFTSGQDRALRLSSRLRGGSVRLGMLRDPSRLEHLPVFLTDLSELRDSGDALLHSKASNSPTMISLVNGMGSDGLEVFRQEERRPSLLEAGIITIQGATDTVANVAGIR